jgi:hypothetical protein
MFIDVKKHEDELKAKVAEEAKGDGAEENKDGEKKKQAKKKKGSSTSIAFGRGVRALFDYLYVLH